MPVLGRDFGGAEMCWALLVAPLGWSVVYGGSLVHLFGGSGGDEAGGLSLSAIWVAELVWLPLLSQEPYIFWH